MGGGKTHAVLALGYMAANPTVAGPAGSRITEGFTPQAAKVVVISGRNIDHDRFLWGTIAQQLGKEDERSEELRVGKECVIRVDPGGRRILKTKKNHTTTYAPNTEHEQAQHTYP